MKENVIDRLDRLESRVAALERPEPDFELADLRTTITRYSKTMDEQNALLAKRDAQIDEMEENVSTLTARIGFYKEESVDTHRKRAGLVNQVRKLEKELKETRELLTEARKAICNGDTDDEWMRLFGQLWYSEKFHKKCLGELKDALRDLIRVCSPKSVGGEMEKLQDKRVRLDWMAKMIDTRRVAQRVLGDG